MRVTIFGANGATGRLLTTQALAAGHEVVAVTRRPTAFPLRHDRLRVFEGDVYDQTAVDGAVRDSDAVLSTLGVPFTMRSITVYSAGVRAVLAAAARYDVKRVVVVSASATRPHRHDDAGVLLNRVMQPLITRTLGRTTYDDMRAMEDLVHASDRAWTVMRPSGLFDLPEPTSYRLDDDHAPGAFTARADLAAAMLAMLGDDRFIGSNVAVTTTEVRPSLVRLVLREAFGAKD